VSAAAPDAVPLDHLAFARPGDKGDDSDVTVFARSREAYDHLVEVLTPELVAAHLGDLVRGDVTRHLVPNVWAVKLVLRAALGGGGPSSLRADNLGKALGGALQTLVVPAPPWPVPPPPRPPADPYAEAPWRVGG
jgi:hypothetical protein